MDDQPARCCATLARSAHRAKDDAEAALRAYLADDNLIAMDWLLSNAIAGWDFSHDGRALPDTVPVIAVTNLDEVVAMIRSSAHSRIIKSPRWRTVCFY